MNRRTASMLAWSLWGLFLVMLVSTPTLAVVNGAPILAGDVTNSLAFLALATVGAVVASRIPSNPLGWLYCGAAILTLMQEVLTEYSRYVSYTRPGILPGGVVAMWVANWVWAPGFSLVLIFSFLLFPDGRLPSARWRPAAWCSAAIVVFLTVTSAMYTEGYTDSVGRPVPNPYAIPALAGFFNAAFGVIQIVLLLPIVVALASVVTRFRRSRGEEREQIKWLLWSAALIAVFLALPLHQGESNVANAISGLLITLIPISAGIAILKYRLYDIDVVISKTVVFGVLAGFITVVYVGIVVGVGALIGDPSNPALAIGATASVALLFGQVRERVRRFANRLVYGRRATPYEVMSGFARRVAGTISVDEILPGMAEAAARGVGARVARVRVALPTGERSVTWPDDAELPGAFGRTLEVRYQGEPVGGIDVVKPANEPFTPTEEQLLEDLAGQAGLAMHNVRLTRELEIRAAELDVQSERLRASRERLVTARDQQRRGLERDIQEGPARQLMEIRQRLDDAGELVDRDAPAAEQLLDRLGGAANATLEELRDLARGIFPPLLVDRGVVAALEAHIRKIGAKARVQAAIGFAELRFVTDVEACVYFCCAQAVQNVIRHAGNAPSTIELALDGGILSFSVRDGGPGFEDAARPDGMGMRIMQDRIDALEGVLTVESTPGLGTLVVGRVPAGVLETLS
ncbi:MAG: GAF domain-containing sensor histidine kinase [Actinomycetota bacterium]